jgi:hypothetical protein
VTKDEVERGKLKRKEEKGRKWTTEKKKRGVLMDR